MLQIRYLFPRFIILATLCLGVWVSSKTLARWAVKNYGDQTFGSNIEAKGINLSLTEGKLSLDGFLLVGKNDGRKLSSDNLTLDLSISELLKSRLVSENAVLTNPTVSSKTDEKTVGHLLKDSLAVSNKGNSVNLDQNLTNESQWLPEMEKQLNAIGSDKVEVANFAKGLKSKWAGQLVDLKKQSKQLNQEIFALQHSNQNDLNPLRVQSQRLKLTQQATAVTTKIVNIKERIQLFRRAASNQLALLDQAKKNKKSQFDRIAKQRVLSTNQVDKTLQYQLPTHKIETMTAWVDWVLNVIPTIENTADGLKKHNGDLAKTDVSSLLIKNLELKGMTAVDNQFFRLLGSISNITDSGNMEAGPTTIELRAQGKSHVMISAIFDRRTGKKVISVKIPATDQPGILIPNFAKHGSKAIGLEIAPSRVFADLQVVVQDDKVSGSLTYRHHAAEMSLVTRGLNKDFQSGLENNLSMLQSFQRSFRFAGSNQKLNVVHNSTLGAQLSHGFNDAVETFVAKTAKQQLGQALAIIDDEQHQLSTFLGKETQDVLNSVDAGLKKVANLSSGPVMSGSSRRQLR